MRGGLDDALDKLARRDELRRRAAAEATGTPAAVQDLVEAIAAVVARNPSLALTVGVEGAGDPVLLHVVVEDGTVQVTADNSVAARATEANAATPKHADFDIDLDGEPYAPQSAYTAASAPASASTGDSGEETRKLNYDDRDRYDPGTGYTTIGYGETTYPTATPERRDDAHFPQPHTTDPGRWYDAPVARPRPAQDSTGPTAEQQYSPHPFVATPPPPTPPHTSRRIHAEQHRAPEEPAAAQRSAAQHAASRAAEHRAASEQPAESRGMPTPLPEPIPLRVDSEETEIAAKRLAALLRDNPSLLRQTPPD